MTNLELLQKTMLFRGSTREDLELVLGLFQEREIRPNANIFTEKMPGEALFIVKNGAVKITMMAGEGKEMGLLVLGPGEFFGELALIHDDTRLVNARAETAVDLLILTRKDFHALLDLDPRTASRLLLSVSKLLAMRIQAYSDKLKELLLS
jgi:CRP/FNR family cyclic AMP-dependent transcriptional regulator